MLYTEPGQAGDFRAMGTAMDGRYEAFRLKDVQLEHWYHKLSSVTIYKPEHGASMLCLFGDKLTGPGQDIAGWTLQLTNNGNTAWNVNLKTSGWEDKNESLLLIHTQRDVETRLSAADFVLERFGEELQNLPDTVIANGLPGVTWRAFPPAPYNHKAIYIQVSLRLTAITPWFAPNYDVLVYFYIRVRRLQSGEIRARVAGFDYWIQSGMLSEVIEAIVVPNCQLIVIRTDEALANFVAPLNQFNIVTDVYLLPGRQLDPLPDGVATSWEHAVNDVTIVLEGLDPELING